MSLNLRCLLRIVVSPNPVLTGAVALVSGLGANIVGTPAMAQTYDAPQSAMVAPQSAIATSGPTFADIAGLADSAGMVVHAKVQSIARVADARAPGLAPGYGRFYVQAHTVALLVGSAPLGSDIAYLVDMPLDRRGKPVETIKKRDVLLFARAVAGHPGQLQLVTPGAQEIWTPQADARVRRILTTLVSPDAPPQIVGVNEILYVPGNLAGQGETQVFLRTKTGSAASITVHHEAGQPTKWGVSFSELTADLSHPPQPDTVEWYRLACFLPHTLAPGVNVSGAGAGKAQAAADYAFVLKQLGPCNRNLR